MFQTIKAYLWGALALVLAGLAIFGQTMKAQRDRAREERDHAKAVGHANRTRSRIIKEKKKEEASLKDAIKNKARRKDDKDFKGVDNLTDSNDW